MWVNFFREICVTETVKKVKAPAKAQSSVPKTVEGETVKVAEKVTAAAPAKPRAKTAKALEVTGKVTPSAPTGPQKVPQKIRTVEERKAPSAPSKEQIAQLAHRFWKERGGHHGAHEQDWFRAERELRGMAS